MTRSLALVAPSETRRSRSRLARYDQMHARLATEVEIMRAMKVAEHNRRIFDQLERDIAIVMEKDPELQMGRV